MSNRDPDALLSRVRRIDTDTLLALAGEGVDASFNARWYPDQLADVDRRGSLLICALLQHTRRPNDPRHLRCVLFVIMHDGTQAMATIDVKNESFAVLPPVNDPTITTTRLLNQSGQTSLVEWLDAPRPPRPSGG